MKLLSNDRCHCARSHDRVFTVQSSNAKTSHFSISKHSVDCQSWTLNNESSDAAPLTMHAGLWYLQMWTVDITLCMQQRLMIKEYNLSSHVGGVDCGLVQVLWSAFVPSRIAVHGAPSSCSSLISFSATRLSVSLLLPLKTVAYVPCRTGGGGEEVRTESRMQCKLHSCVCVRYVSVYENISTWKKAQGWTHKLSHTSPSLSSLM